jgi:division protein CdvB (Snf7/Vps24/ESCRT-III family)
MEDIKELFKELVEEMEEDLGDWESIPETEADKTFKEKMIGLVKEKYWTE